MALIKWPSDLGLGLLKKHSLKPNSGIISTKMDSGHPRTRRVFKNKTVKIPYSKNFTSAQLALFEGFIEHKINGGADWFVMPIKLPLGVIDSEVRIIPDSISFKLLTNRLWSVSFNMELRDQLKADIELTDILVEEGSAALGYAVNTINKVYR